MINVVVLVGRLTKDPELRKTSSGISTCRFTVAVDRNFKGQNGQKETDFINCIAWRTTADLMCQYLGKGSLVGIQGRIQTGSYDNAQGQRVFTTDVVAESVQFLEPRGARASQNSGAYQGGYQNNGGYDGQSFGGNQGYGSNQGYSRPQNNGYGGQPNNGYSRGQAAPYPQDFGQNDGGAGNPYSSKVNDSLDNAFDNSETLNIADDDLPF